MGLREDYQALMEKQLNAWKAQTEQFKQAADKLGADARTRYEQNLALLHAKQDEAWENYRKLRNSGDEAWEQVKGKMEKAHAEIKDLAERVTREFKA